MDDQQDLKPEDVQQAAAAIKPQLEDVAPEGVIPADQEAARATRDAIPGPRDLAAPGGDEPSPDAGFAERLAAIEQLIGDLNRRISQGETAVLREDPRGEVAPGPRELATARSLLAPYVAQAARGNHQSLVSLPREPLQRALAILQPGATLPAILQPSAAPQVAKSPPTTSPPLTTAGVLARARQQIAAERGDEPAREPAAPLPAAPAAEPGAVPTPLDLKPPPAREPAAPLTTVPSADSPRSPAAAPVSPATQPRADPVPDPGPVRPASQLPLFDKAPAVATPVAPEVSRPVVTAVPQPDAILLEAPRAIPSTTTPDPLLQQNVQTLERAAASPDIPIPIPASAPPPATARQEPQGLWRRMVSSITRVLAGSRQQDREQDQEIQKAATEDPRELANQIVTQQVAQEVKREDPRTAPPAPAADSAPSSSASPSPQPRLPASRLVSASPSRDSKILAAPPQAQGNAAPVATAPPATLATATAISGNQSPDLLIASAPARPSSPVPPVPGRSTSQLATTPPQVPVGAAVAQTAENQPPITVAQAATTPGPSPTLSSVPPAPSPAFPSPIVQPAPKPDDHRPEADPQGQPATPKPDLLIETHEVVQVDQPVLPAPDRGTARPTMPSVDIPAHAAPPDRVFSDTSPPPATAVPQVPAPYTASPGPAIAPASQGIASPGQPAAVLAMADLATPMAGVSPNVRQSTASLPAPRPQDREPTTPASVPRPADPSFREIITGAMASAWNGIQQALGLRAPTADVSPGRDLLSPAPQPTVARPSTPLGQAGVSEPHPAPEDIAQRVADRVGDRVLTRPDPEIWAAEQSEPVIQQAPQPAPPAPPIVTLPSGSPTAGPPLIETTHTREAPPPVAQATQPPPPALPRDLPSSRQHAGPPSPDRTTAAFTGPPADQPLGSVPDAPRPPVESSVPSEPLVTRPSLAPEDAAQLAAAVATSQLDVVPPDEIRQVIAHPRPAAADYEPANQPPLPRQPIDLSAAPSPGHAPETHVGSMAPPPSPTRPAINQQTVQPAAFVPTDQWQDIPDGEIMPPGLQIRLNASTGRNQARRSPVTQQIDEQPADEREQNAPAPLGAVSVPPPDRATARPETRQIAAAAEQPVQNLVAATPQPAGQPPAIIAPPTPRWSDYYRANRTQEMSPVRSAVAATADYVGSYFQQTDPDRTTPAGPPPGDPSSPPQGNRAAPGKPPRPPRPPVAPAAPSPDDEPEPSDQPIAPAPDRTTARPDEPVASPPAGQPEIAEPEPAARPDDEPPPTWQERFQERRSTGQGRVAAAVGAAWNRFQDYVENRHDASGQRAAKQETPRRPAAPDPQASVIPGDVASQVVMASLVQRPGEHILESRARLALEQDQELADRNAAQYREAQALDRVPRGITTPEAYYAAQHLGFRPGDPMAATEAGRRDRSDDQGRTWEQAGAPGMAAREEAVSLLEATRQAMREERALTRPQEPVADQLRRNPNLTAADVHVIQQRAAHGAPVNVEDYEHAQQPTRSWGQRMMDAGGEALEQMPIAGRFIHQMRNMRGAMARSAPVLAEVAPGLARGLFGEAAAAGTAGAELGGVARAVTGPAGLAFGAAMAAGQYVHYKGHQGIATAAEGAAPFIGREEAGIGGGMAATAWDFASGPGELIKATASLPRNIMEWTDALIDSKRELAQWSGLMGRMYAEETRRTAVRGMESAQAIGGSMSELSTEFQDLLDQIRPMKDAVTVVIAEGLTMLVKSMQKVIWVLEHTPVGYLLKKIEENTSKENPNATRTFFDDWIKGWQDGQVPIQSQRPPPS